MKVILDLSRIPKIPAQGGLLKAPCFFPIMGKPIIQHTLEALERKGCREIHIFLYDYADEIERLLGDGERWGVKISYILLKAQKHLLERMHQAPFIADDELFLFGNGLVLPQLPDDLFSSEEMLGLTDEEGRCLQWAVTDKATVLRFDLVSQDPISPMERKRQVPMLSVRTGQEYLRSCRLALDKQFEGLIIIGHEVRNGIWLGPGVKVPKTTTLVPPVYIDQQTKLGDHDIIGPYAQLGRGCVVDDESFITESSLFDYSYIGKQLDVKESVIHKNQIYHVPLGTVYAATDDIFLTDTAAASPLAESAPAAPFLSRFVALLLYLLFLPVTAVTFIYCRLSRGYALETIEYVRLPQQQIPEQPLKTVRLSTFKTRQSIKGRLINHFLFLFLPGLMGVIRGKARFCGLQPRTAGEVESLTESWRELYLSSSIGLIAEADVLYREYPDEQMLYATDIFYSVHDTFRYNAVLVGKYLIRLFSDRNRM
jgi:mannose-1-phosphate guanylyltransferase / phosphomannomutase